MLRTRRRKSLVCFIFQRVTTNFDRVGERFSSGPRITLQIAKRETDRDIFLPRFEGVTDKSTVTELDLFRSQHRSGQPHRTWRSPPVAPGIDLRGLWSDVLASVAIVTLASTVLWMLLR